MPNFNSPTPTLFSDLLNDVQVVQYDPSSCLTTVINALQSATNGQIIIVDPSNPFVWGLSASSVMTCAAIAEMDLLNSRLYAKNAMIPEDVYMHMCDKDFINQFAEPTKAVFTFLIELNSFQANSVDNYSLGGKCIKIARNTQVTVNGVNFSLQYPINIVQLYGSGGYQASYDTSSLSPLQSLPTNIIPTSFRSNVTSSTGTNQYLTFDIPMTQFDIITSNFPIEVSKPFKQSTTLNPNNNYWYCRVYYQNTSTKGGWVEIETSYTDQVFDSLSPTALISIIGNQVNVEIPLVYVNTNLISGYIRIDVYETIGSLMMDLSNYNVNNSQINFLAIDSLDSDIYTAAMNNAFFMCYSATQINGGLDAIPFSTLRKNVINNTTGPIVIPITNAQLDTKVSENGFSIIKNIDLVTDRKFLVTQALPLPSNDRLITPMCTSMFTLMTSMSQLKMLAVSNINNDIWDNTQINNNGDIIGRITIGPKTLYLYNNGLLSIYPDAQVAAIINSSVDNITTIVNELDFLFSPFYYVFDNTGDQFNVKAYDLDSPSANGLDFISQNSTANCVVSTSAYGLNAVSNGYKLTITVASDALYKSIPDANVGLQLSFIPYGETVLAYMNGKLLTDSNGVAVLTNGERTFEFLITSTMDCDSNDNIYLNSFNFQLAGQIPNPTPLTTTFTLLHYTNSVSINFVPDSSNMLLGQVGTPNGAVTITYENMNLVFGTALTYLWTDTRSIVNPNKYQTYSNDVYQTYANDVFELDPITGSAFAFSTVNASDITPNMVCTISSVGTTNFESIGATDNKVGVGFIALGPTTGNGTITSITTTLKHKAGDPILLNGSPILLHSVGDTIFTNGEPTPLPNQDILRAVDMLMMDGIYFFVTDPIFLYYVIEVKKTFVNWIESSILPIEQSLMEKTSAYFYAEQAMGMVNVLNKNGNALNIEARQTFNVDCYVGSGVVNNSTLTDAIQVSIVQALNTAMTRPQIVMSEIISDLMTSLAGSITGLSISGLGGVNDFGMLTLTNPEQTLSIMKKIINRGDGFLVTTEDVNINFFGS